MAHAHTPIQTDRGDAQIDEDHHLAQNGGTTGGGRRWYHFRPEPPRRTDLMGVNSIWWMALGWLILILLVVFPFPFWSW
jgi:hypothetical protein